ncbi:tripartite tricarboxylate transporter TctB family protein [Microvirga sp. 2TAF3]|uniref:tripartite tricarboxylate transporter TctB family protein n=1 Tax=Microvirga sp. 2TAF3 TaxID=3233014 RepID=UPI003F9E3740
MLRSLIKDPRDALTGLLFGSVGLGAVVLGLGYNFGSITRMGPGFFPVVLGVVLCAIGLGCLAKSLKVSGETVEPLVWRPLVLVTASVVVFGALVRMLGFVPAVIATTILASLASHQFAWRRSLILAVVLAGLCTAMFIYGLGLPFAPFSAGGWR